MSNKSINQNKLNEMISLLEAKQAEEIRIFKEELSNVIDGLNPINMLKSAVSKIDEDDLQETIEPGLSFLTKKLIVGKSNSPLKEFLGSAAQLGVSALLSNHSDKIKIYTKTIYKLLKGNKKKDEDIGFE